MSITASTNNFKALIKELAGLGYQYHFRLKDLPGGQRLLEASPQAQCDFVAQALAWVHRPRLLPRIDSYWCIFSAIATLLRRKLPFTHDTLIALLRYVKDDVHSWSIDSYLPQVVENYLAAHELTPQLRATLAQLIKALQTRSFSTDQRRRLTRLMELSGQIPDELPLEPGDIWSDAAIAEIQELDDSCRAAWGELLRHCTNSSGSSPSGKWRLAARALLARAGADNVRATLVRWFALADAPRVTPVVEPWGGERHAQLLIERNADILKGLAWLCAELEDRGIARALTALAISAYRKVPMIGG
jgi:hypothetical protein